MCDSFSYDDYPVYVMPNEDFEKKKKEYEAKSMQSLNEVIRIDEKGKVTENY